MNILIISHFYEKDGVMGSVRWTSFAHRLAKKHNVFVATHDDGVASLAVEPSNGITVLKIDNECNYVKRGKNKVAPQKTQEKLVLESVEAKKQPSSLKNILRTSLYMESMRFSAKKNASHIMQYLTQNSIHIDCVISTSRPFIDCFIGYYIAKRMHSPWILDQRDLAYNDGDSDFTMKAYCRWFKRMEPKVSAFTLVSYGMAKMFAEHCRFEGAKKEKIKVLHNGYDTEHRAVSLATNQHAALTVSYAGDMYLGRRDADMLFAAIKQVADTSSEISANDFSFSYAGKEGAVVRLQAEKYGIQAIVNDYGFVPHAQAIRLQQESDLLLLLTWNTGIDQGILPGKFYEYMMAEKPIICITCGSLPNGEAEHMINNMHLGIAVNEIEYKKGIEQLALYLKQQMQNKKQKQKIIYTPDKAKVLEFNYDNLALKLEQLIEEIV